MEKKLEDEKKRIETCEEEKVKVKKRNSVFFNLIEVPHFKKSTWLVEEKLAGTKLAARDDFKCRVKRFI